MEKSKTHLISIADHALLRRETSNTKDDMELELPGSDNAGPAKL